MATHSCLENPMNRGAWQATVHRVAQESDTNAATWHSFTDAPSRRAAHEALRDQSFVLVIQWIYFMF